ncbi:hypothetical protein ACIA5C_09750 [Actinoplanes sp. NPDC051343]|uniref:hypothetical protein n=1 Tax=Actinoplanes sp. NPDC051343 TaxID=3363906 RepID=UPI0037AF1873
MTNRESCTRPRTVRPVASHAGFDAFRSGRECIKQLSRIDSNPGLLDTTSEVFGNDVYSIISEPFVELSIA